METIELIDALDDLNIDLNPCTVFAYLPNATVTTIAEANVYQPVAGPFTNAYISGWSTGTDYIYYTGTNSKQIKIIGMWTASSDTNTNLITLAIKKNGIVLSGSETAQTIKFNGDYVSWSGNVSTVINHDDTIQIVVKSNKVGSKITFEYFQTNLFAEKLTYE